MYDNLDLGLINKVAIVAGGGSANEEIGNGRAAAILLAEAGCKVLVVDKNEKSANQTVDIIREKNGVAISVEGDLTIASECKKVVNLSIKTWGRLDILDNNIGIDSNVFVLEKSIAVLADFAFSSLSTFTIPNAFF